MKKRKIPLRKCISCGVGRPKKELVRIVKTNEGEVLVDLIGRVNGRGAYVCPSIKCLDEAINTKKISRSLGKEVDKSIYEELKKQIEKEVIDQENTFK